MFVANKSLLALGEPNRQKIIKLLSKKPLSAQEVSDSFTVSRPAISKHLRILVEADLIEYRSMGTRNIYQLRQKGFDSIRNELDSMWSHALARFKLLAENTIED